MVRATGWVVWLVMATACGGSGLLERGKQTSFSASVPLERGDVVVRSYRVSLVEGANPSRSPATFSIEPSQPCLGELDGGFTCSEDAASGISIEVRFLDGTQKRTAFTNCAVGASCSELVQVRHRVIEAPLRRVRAEYELRLVLGSGGFDRTGLSIVPE